MHYCASLGFVCIGNLLSEIGDQIIRIRQDKNQVCDLVCQLS